jgi:hypothetical protein
MILRPCWILALTLAASGAIDPDLPSPAPTVRAAFPPGLERGTSAEIELTGANLHDTRLIEFAGRGVRAELLSASAARVKLRVSVDPGAETGRRDYRLTTARGVAVGILDIGALPEIQEKENNDDWRKPQAIALPVLVNGAIGSEDWDHFRIHAEAGQKLIFDVSATRYGSRLDADLAILDSSSGTELAWIDDTTIFGDPHLEFTFDKAGDYVIRVGSLNGGGNYRLSVGALPYARRTLPAGLQAGESTTLTFTGSLLNRVDEIWIGDRVAKGEILSKSASEIRARFLAPKSTAPGRYLVHLLSQGNEIALPTEIRISNVPEVTVTGSPHDRTAALAIAPATVLNGVIDQPKESHYFRFEAAAGDSFLFRAESMKLGYHLDPTLTVLDSAGNKVAYADDPGIDDRADEYQLDTDLSYRCEKAGTYYIAIRDGMYRGGEQLVYRLTVERQPPDFILEIRESLKSFYSGQQDTLQVRVRRRSGWDAPVDVWVEGLPSGFQAERQTVPPKDSIVKDTCGVERIVDGTIALLPIRVDGSATAGTFDFRVKARGAMHGRTVEHQAIVRYNHASVGHLYGPMQVQRAQITVTAPPGVLLTLPDTVTHGSASTPIAVTVRRFGDAKQTALRLRPKNLPTGLDLAAVAVPGGVRDATVTLTGTLSGASEAMLVLEAVSTTDNMVIGESAPIRIQKGK